MDLHGAGLLMNAAVVLLALGAAVVGVAAASSGKKRRPMSSARDALSSGHRAVRGMPGGMRVAHEMTPQGFVRAKLDGLPIEHAEAALLAKGQHAIGGGVGNDKTQAALDKWVSRHRQYAAILQAEWAKRRATLPPDAKAHQPDRYTKGLFPVPTWATLPPSSLTYDSIQQNSNQRLTDEFGRGKPGHIGFGGSITDSFARLLSNPLLQATLSAAAFAFGGPAGLAAYGAFNAYVIRGEELTFESAALTAGRTAAVAQCGPACGVAFDVGVGIASGDSIDTAAQKAALGAMSPTERAYYEQGRAMYAEHKDELNI